MSQYTFDKTLDLPFDAAVAKVTDGLKAQGFGILTTIDIKKTLKEKINEDFQPYTILGACSPKHAFRALSTEVRIGSMLPCNVVVRQREDGKVEVSAIDPIASMTAVDNPQLRTVATEVQAMLKTAIDAL